MIPFLDESTGAGCKLKIVHSCIPGHPIQDFLCFLGTIRIFDDENGIEYSSSFHQCSQLMVRPSSPISKLVYRSGMQAQTCSL